MYHSLFTEEEKAKRILLKKFIKGKLARFISKDQADKRSDGVTVPDLHSSSEANLMG